MGLTTGQLFFYGGVIGAGLSFLIMLAVFIVSESKKKKLLQDLGE